MRKVLYNLKVIVTSSHMTFTYIDLDLIRI